MNLPKNCHFWAGILKIFAIVVILLAGVGSAKAATIYVKADAEGAHTGGSWADAYTSLQDGLAVAVDGDEVWIAAGLYRPDRGNGIVLGDRGISFRPRPGVAIYGGFSGQEILLAQRNWQKYKTVLSGDLNGNDTLYSGGYEENSYHVVRFEGGDGLNATVLDGIIVSHGSALSLTVPNNNGAGLYLFESSPFIRNCTVKDNIAYNGGGIFIAGGKPSFANCLIANNRAETNGGAFFAAEGTGILFIHATITGNSATQGGGIYADAVRMTVNNSILWGNKARIGRQFYLTPAGYAALAFCDVEGGREDIEAGVGLKYGKNMEEDPRLSPAGRLQTGSPCIDAGTPLASTLTDWDGENRYGGALPDLGADEFVDSDGDGLADAWERLWFADLTVSGGGDSDGDGLADVEEQGTATDPLSGDSDGDDQGDLAEVRQGTDPLDRQSFAGRLYVDGRAGGRGDGSSWTDACRTLQDALIRSWRGAEIWVAAGTYRPDQGGGVVAGNRKAAFDLKTDVALYGGFDGTESELAQRNWNRNKTVLSGDLAGNDAGLYAGDGENSIHVVRFISSLTTPFFAGTILDGFVITGGNASDSGGSGGYFAGTSPQVRNCVIKDNRTIYNGGGLYIHGGAPTLVNCLVKGNAAGSAGGGLHIVEAHAQITHCTITDNNAKGSAGGLFVSIGATSVANSILWGNHAHDGSQVYFAPPNGEKARYSIQSSDVEDGPGAIPGATDLVYEGNIDAEPLLTPAGRLRPGSPCIDAAPVVMNGTDIDDEPRPAGLLADMGMDEFADSDGDGLPDGWERSLLGTTAEGPGVDSDRDGLDDGGEFLAGTNPRAVDSDGDGAQDFVEILEGSDPLNPVSHPGRLFVDSRAGGSVTGASWANAFTRLDSALTKAWPGCQIWVAAGTYRPVTSKVAFRLKPGVALYGGFAGTEQVLAQRDPNRNQTILSGDLKNDDQYNFANYNENSSRVVEFIDTQSPSFFPSALLDGFIISHAADRGLVLSNTSPLVKNCVIRDNKGGGVSITGGSPTFINCHITANSAETGGGLIVEPGLARPRLIHCTLNGNSATYGGGVFAWQGELMITASILWDNQALLGPQLYLNPDEFAPAIASIHDSDMAGGKAIVFGGVGSDFGGNIDADPLLTSDGRLTAQSPCIDAVHSPSSTPADCDNEARPGGQAPDMGWDELIDTDADGLADSWERRRNGGIELGTADDSDDDGLSSLDEYEAGTDPANRDSDGDGFTDSQELTTGADPLDRQSFPGRIYVSARAGAGGDGKSWASAYTTIQDALVHAWSGSQIWVANGTYRPGSETVLPADSAGITLKSGVALIGGFAGSEDNLSQRDWQQNETILTGQTATGLSRPVVAGDNLIGSTLLDGFTVTGGQGATGGGLRLFRSQLKIARCTFQANEASNGGALYAFGSTVTVADSSFTGNHAYQWGQPGNGRGGAIFSFASSLTVRRALFADNSAETDGGALSVDGTVSLDTTLALRNEADSGGTLVMNSGSAMIIHSTLTHNLARSWGGAMAVHSGEVKIVNSILWGNRAVAGRQIWTGIGPDAISLTIDTSVMEGGVAAIYQTGETWLTYGENFEIDPLLTPDGHLQAQSPCIDSALTLVASTLDYDREPRPRGAGPDIGSDEFTDGDGDGLPDFWELRYGLESGSGAAGDPDGDGFENAEEYAHGASPVNPVDNDGDGVSVAEGDCNDLDPEVRPGIAEVYFDGKDNDCDGLQEAYFLPAIRDGGSLSMVNNLSIQAREPVAMTARIQVYDEAGVLLGTHLYSDTDPEANAPAIAPQARAALRPAAIAGLSASAQPVIGSVLVETSVPALVSSNAMAYGGTEFAIFAAVQPRSVHHFPKTYDVPGNYQATLVVWNIHAEPVTATVRLAGKTEASPGHGAEARYTIPPLGAIEARPSEIAGGMDFDGSVTITSDFAEPGDGLGPALPALCRNEAGIDGLALYEGVTARREFFFPILRDGWFDNPDEYKNFVSIVNPGIAEARVTMVLYNWAGQEEGRVADVVIAAGGKKTWRPSWIKGSAAAPLDFVGAMTITATAPVLGQTNTIYAGGNRLGIAGYDLFEGVETGPVLFFPKAFDNLPAVDDGTHLTENTVSLQNPGSDPLGLVIEAYHSDGLPAGVARVTIGPHASQVFRPRELLQKGSRSFRGSLRVSATGLVAGAMLYEMHWTSDPASTIAAIAIYAPLIEKR